MGGTESDRFFAIRWDRCTVRTSAAALCRPFFAQRAPAWRDRQHRSGTLFLTLSRLCQDPPKILPHLFRECCHFAVFAARTRCNFKIALSFSFFHDFLRRLQRYQSFLQPYPKMGTRGRRMISFPSSTNSSLSVLLGHAVKGVLARYYRSALVPPHIPTLNEEQKKLSCSPSLAKTPSPRSAAETDFRTLLDSVHVHAAGRVW